MYRFEDQVVRAQPIQQVRAKGDLKKIVFTDGVAAVELPFALLRHVKLKNDRRDPSPRLEAVKDAIRRDGYVPFDPIIAAITKKGKWSVVDGGHRLTAARAVAREFWTNLFGRKVRTLYFLLFTTPRSLTGLKAKKREEKAAGAAVSVPPDRIDIASFEDEDEDTRV